MTPIRSLLVTAAAVVLVFAGSAVARPASQKSLGTRAAAAALAQRGDPYVWGGASPEYGFDSAGLVMWVYARVGHLQLPHSAPFLKRLGHPVGRQALRRGDLVFFDHNLDVGIYVGSGYFVHAPGPARTKVRRDSMRKAKYFAGYTGSIRLTGR